MVRGVLWWAALMGTFGCGGEAPPAPPPVAPAAPDTPAVDVVDAGPLSVDITIDASEPSKGWLKVTERWSGIAGPFSVRTHGDDSYKVRGVRYTSVDGEPLGVRPKASRFEVRARPIPSDLVVSYEVRPGGDGRHGKQGFADDRFVVFDGRALLLPIAPQPLERARFRFTMPEGWSVATAMVEDDEGWWVADPPSGSVLLERLMKECHGLGPWVQQDFRRGDTTVRSFVHGELAPELQDEVMADTEAVWGWFHDKVGYDPGHPMAFVRTPNHRGERIFGGASMMGACYEAQWTRRPDRNRYLLGHRFGHPFNKYPPVGLSPHGPEEHWFTEGWASYAEVLAVEETGRIEAGTYFPALWRVHRDRVVEHPDWLSLPLADEARLSGEQKEYVHYFRSPLLVRTLAHLVEARSDTDLEAFVKHLGQTHGHHRAPYHLQEELEAFTGASFEDFWTAYVRGHTWVAPSFPGVADADARDRSRRPMIARTGGVGVDVNYLAALGATGRFHDVTALLDFVGKEGPTRTSLAAAGVRLLPAEARPYVAGLSPLQRESLARAEADWPVHVLGRLRAAVTPDLTWLDHPHAPAFRAWATDAEQHRRTTIRGGIDRIALRVGNKAAAEDRPDVLVVPPDEPFTLYVWWREPREAAKLELLHGDEIVWQTSVTEQPGWIRNRLVVDVDDRPARPGLLTVRVRDGAGELLGQRSFFQWAPEASSD